MMSMSSFSLKNKRKEAHTPPNSCAMWQRQWLAKLAAHSTELGLPKAHAASAKLPCFALCVPGDPQWLGTLTQLVRGFGHGFSVDTDCTEAKPNSRSLVDRFAQDRCTSLKAASAGQSILAAAWVRRPIGDEALRLSCGMHMLGQPGLQEAAALALLATRQRQAIARHPAALLLPRPPAPSAPISPHAWPLFALIPHETPRLQRTRRSARPNLR